MELHITPGSPYARMARIVVLEKGLADRVTVIPAQTRQTDSPYYRIAPSGRVPFLVCDDGVSFEESSLVCAVLDYLDGSPIFDIPPGPPGWRARRLEALARSLMDGVSVWLREIRRPEDERSGTTVRHETDRARRLADLWETEIADPVMHDRLNMPQITLGCALGLETRVADFRWRAEHPALRAWYDAIAARPSFVATAPAD